MESEEEVGYMLSTAIGEVRSVVDSRRQQGNVYCKG